MYESILGVTDADSLVAAIGQCRASANHARVTAYIAEHGLSSTPVAVIVQEMVEGDASGVMFSSDPADPDQALISAAWGLGEGVVQGTVPCDTVRVGLDGAVELLLAKKDQAVSMVDGSPPRFRFPRRCRLSLRFLKTGECWPRRSVSSRHWALRKTSSGHPRSASSSCRPDRSRRPCQRSATPVGQQQHHRELPRAHLTADLQLREPRLHDRVPVVLSRHGRQSGDDSAECWGVPDDDWSGPRAHLLQPRCVVPGGLSASGVSLESLVHGANDGGRRGRGSCGR